MGLPLPESFSTSDAEFTLNVLMFALLGMCVALLFGLRGLLLGGIAGIALRTGGSSGCRSSSPPG